MRKFVLLIIVLISLSSCAQSQIPEGDWVDIENEQMLLSIKKEDGKYWMYYFEQPTELYKNENEIFFKRKDQKYPVTIDNEKDILEVLGYQYIPVAKSMKGQFTGKWANESETTVFIVKLDGNVNLTWDFIEGDYQSVRFYPKRSDSGFHFTIDQDTLSYTLKNGLLYDNNGMKYNKREEIN